MTRPKAAEGSGIGVDCRRSGSRPQHEGEAEEATPRRVHAAALAGSARASTRVAPRPQMETPRRMASGRSFVARSRWRERRHYFPERVVGVREMLRAASCRRPDYRRATNVGPAYFFSRRSTFSRTISASTTGFAR